MIAEPITAVPGIGPVRARVLGHLGLDTVGDLLLHAPRGYIDLRRSSFVRQLQHNRPAAVHGVIERAQWRRSQGDRSLWIGTATLRDDEGQRLQLVWFRRTARARRPEPLPAPHPQNRWVATGVARWGSSTGWQMHSPDLARPGPASLHTGRIVPVYPLTTGVTQKMMRNFVSSALARFAHGLPDPMPSWVRDEVGFPSLGEGLGQLHFPDDWSALHRARQRLAFDELMALRFAMVRERDDQAMRVPPLPPVFPVFLEQLPFKLTGAQRRVLEEIDGDLARPRPMRRLLQGDVGSGKTVVAAYALARAAMAGGQAAFLAPSDVLARQHAKTLKQWLAADGITVELLRGATGPEDRRRLLTHLAAGQPLIVVGTHALLHDAVRFARLDLLVVDEQHRFGVVQRRALLRSPRPPHMLVISATPIPRTLAHTVYGDLDVSILDEAPPGRQPVDTRWIRPERREDVYRFVRQRVEQGEQAFVVFPAIGGDPFGEEEDDTDGLLQSARSLMEGPLKGLDVVIAHGRQKRPEQEAAFDRFARGGASVMLATTVVEVGVDVPRATVMVVEDADKFGLAQLHQLRGRVGRGGGDAWCFLVAEPTTSTARRRLQVLRTTDDGFALARQDVLLRGPGELLGTRQSGLPDLSAIGQGAEPSTLAFVQRWVGRLLATGAGSDPELAQWRDAVRRRAAMYGGAAKGGA